MPAVKGPATLFEISENVVVDFLTLPWRCKQLFTNETSDIINSIISIIPATSIDNVVSRVIKEFSQLRIEKSSNEHAPGHLLLKAVVVPQLQVLDFRTLVNLGYVTNEQLFKFQYTAASLIPSLRNLISLSFSTHKNEYTLPICDDEVIKNVGFCCAQIKYLNIRCCNYVTDEGLKFLIPKFSDGRGCTHLEELYLYESSVTSNGVTLVLEHLRKLRIVDFRELCTALIHLYKKCVRTHSAILQEGLEITHINNLGVCRPAQKLQFDNKAVKVVQSLCPRLKNLKIRVSDFDVASLKGFSSLTTVELMYNVGRPVSPGDGTENFLFQYGYQLTCVALICDLFAVELFVTIGENCPNLKQLWLKCNDVLSYPEWVEPKSQNLCYSQLESIYVRIGESEKTEHFLPASVLAYILRNSFNLKNLQLIFRSTLMSDSWFESILQCITTENLEKVFIGTPGYNSNTTLDNLSMKTVDTVKLLCPRLKKLGNLLVWNVNRSQVNELKDEITTLNLDLVIVYRLMTIK